MRKWIPYIIGLLIPVMIFISFAWMIKKRTFIFRDEFVQQATVLMDHIEIDFQEAFKRDVLQKFFKIEAKLLESKGDGMNIFLKNQVVDSSILDNIFITDSSLTLKYFYAPYPKNKIDELIWAVKNQGEGRDLKVFFAGESYLVYKDFNDLKIFISLNPSFFYKTLKEKYTFLKDNLFLTQKKWFLNFTEKSYQSYQNYKDLAKETEMKTESGHKTLLELKGDYVFGKKAVLKDEAKELWAFNFFAYIEPSHFPMSLWHRILLVVIAVLVIVMFLMLLFKIKNDSVLRQMTDYGTDNEDFLEKNAITAYEDENESRISIIEDESEEEEEYLEIPDEYFKKEGEPVKKQNEELTSIIGEVKEHEEEVQKYNSLWKNISSSVSGEGNHFLLGLVDEESGDIVPHFQKDISPESPLNISLKNWIIETFILNKRALFVTESAMQAKPVKDIFPPEYYSEVNSVFIAPIENELKEVTGIFLLFSSEKLEESLIREINSLIRMG